MFAIFLMYTALAPAQQLARNPDYRFRCEHESHWATSTLRLARVRAASADRLSFETVEWFTDFSAADADVWPQDRVWFAEAHASGDHAQVRVAAGELFLVARHCAPDSQATQFIRAHRVAVGDAADLRAALRAITAIRRSTDRSGAFLEGLAARDDRVRRYCLQTLSQAHGFMLPRELSAALRRVRDSGQEEFSCRFLSAAALGSDRQNPNARREEFDWLLKTLLQPHQAGDGISSVAHRLGELVAAAPDWLAPEPADQRRQDSARFRAELIRLLALRAPDPTLPPETRVTCMRLLASLHTAEQPGQPESNQIVGTLLTLLLSREPAIRIVAGQLAASVIASVPDGDGASNWKKQVRDRLRVAIESDKDRSVRDALQKAVDEASARRPRPSNDGSPPAAPPNPPDCEPDYDQDQL